MNADDLLRHTAGEQGALISDRDKLATQTTDELYRLIYVRTSQMAAPCGSSDLNLRSRSGEDDALRTSEATEIGRRIFMRWSKTLHAFVCAPQNEDADLRSQLVSAIVGKGGGAAALVAGTLVASFGLSPAVSALVAALLLKLIVAPAADELCATWQAYNKAWAG